MSTKLGGPNGSIRHEDEYTHGANAGLKIAIELCGMLRFILATKLLILYAKCLYCLLVHICFNSSNFQLSECMNHCLKN